MRDENVIRLRGRLTKDSEISNGDNPRTTFRVATNIPYKTSSGERRERVTFHNVVIWGKKYKLLKGTTVSVKGEVEIWEPKDNNPPRSIYGVRCFEFSVCSTPTEVP